ncbi:hypothetical protein Cni_G26488 [Canna indica]|uniref:Uncharacterized protein n=1 Tax=Canna indica TaxID=4628 RepID=A0AAQ3KZV2_9LILI|nr:hypothetical protein Cni_G26488 [Canna indica]
MMTTAAAVMMPPAQRSRVCFSFAAYSKTVVAHLRASGIPVAFGLSDAEFSAVESAYGFEFPPDIRSILSEGLPIGPGFPNWRSASPQQLRLLLGLPAAGLLQAVSAGGFWPRSWGSKPRDHVVAAAAARSSMRWAPPLVPVYRNFYIPASPNLAGNPVFYVRGGDVRLAGLDLPDFFRRKRPRGWEEGAPAPAWAATSARRVEVWTELAEGGFWHERQQRGSPWEERVELRLEEAGRRLRKGGWSDEDVGEMVAVGMDGVDEEWLGASAGEYPSKVLRNQGSVLRQLQLLSLSLIRGGWSAEEVVESMGWARAASESEDGSDGDEAVKSTREQTLGPST